MATVHFCCYYQSRPFAVQIKEYKIYVHVRSELIIEPLKFNLSKYIKLEYHFVIHQEISKTPERIAVKFGTFLLALSCSLRKGFEKFGLGVEQKEGEDKEQHI